MNANFLKQNPTLSIFAILGAGALIYRYWPKLTQNRAIAEANQRLKELIREEANQSTPYPKEVDMEPN